ncbi:MAG: hypothetical protein ACE5Q6_10915 [Dehalococcoidia bacterium]
MTTAYRGTDTSATGWAQSIYAFLVHDLETYFVLPSIGAFDKLRPSGCGPFVVSHFGKLRTGLSNHLFISKYIYGACTSRGEQLSLTEWCILH